MIADATKIGLISDTHGLLRPQALRALEGTELIIHAGDIGNPEILDALKKLAPVFAVRGNVDTEPWTKSLSETEVIETALATFYVLHEVHALDLDSVAAGFHIVSAGIRINRRARNATASSTSIRELQGRAASICR